MFKSNAKSRIRNRSRRTDRPRPRIGLESLEGRITPAVTATFTPGAAILTIIGDSANNAITVSRNAAGAILVNGGAVAILGGTPTVANTAQITLFGLGGNDTLTLDEASGALPQANIFGGEGNDTLTGGSGADQLFGQGGNDTLLGKGGNDLLFGGDGNDVLTGGDADDQVFGQAGDDRLVWNPGDDTDLNEGGAGTDTVEVNGGNGAEAFTVVANGTRVRFDRINPAAFSIDIGTSENLVLNANGGDDSFSAGNGLSALIKITANGGAGNDTLTGGDGNDTLFGGDGNDLIDGNRGDDVAFMGAGDDVFVWDPGDGSDVVEGQDGNDRMVFNGANIAEEINITANGGRVRFTRNIANIVMDLNDVEGIDFNALGGADSVTVGDLSGTDATAININLGAFGGGGDGQADSVVVNGTNGNDAVEVLGAGTGLSVVGLHAVVNVSNSEGANDRLTINALAGNDAVTAAALPAGIAKLAIDGGAGNDTLLGSAGADTITGGTGNDSIDGNRGDDIAFMGAGDDTFTWDPGDGSDVVEGQEGYDTLQFNGANIAEEINIFANGGRVRFTRNVASVTMDLDDTERINFVALGGADTIAVGDLSGTDATTINLDLAGTPGGAAGDGQADSVTVNGTNGDDAIQVVGTGNGASVVGLKARVNLIRPEGANDRLTVNALAGNDIVNAGNLAKGVVHLALNGGSGSDTLFGSYGADLINGGQGDDVALMGAGDDTFVWNPGDGNDIVEGQAGFDTMLFNGANIAEQIGISANGGRVRFTRNIANIVMDLNDVEGIDFNALGGADVITVNDLSGTDVTEINLNLAGSLNGDAGDGQADSIIVNGTNGDDVVVVSGDASGTSVLGLAARVNITGAEPANDRLTINMLAGDDVLQASALAAAAIGLVVDGGTGDDILIGGAGADVIRGGDGDDVLIGGPGNDVLDGGAGDNVVIQG